MIMVPNCFLHFFHIHFFQLKRVPLSYKPGENSVRIVVSISVLLYFSNLLINSNTRKNSLFWLESKVELSYISASSLIFNLIPRRHNFSYFMVFVGALCATWRKEALVSKYSFCHVQVIHQTRERLFHHDINIQQREAGRKNEAQPIFFSFFFLPNSWCRFG